MTRQMIETDIGTEVQCAKCKEFWPADLEFFYFKDGRPHSWCKACYLADPKVIEKRKRSLVKQESKRVATRVGTHS
jgi:hypothetical protein